MTNSAPCLPTQPSRLGGLRRLKLSSRLPSNMTEGKIPRALPDHFKADLSRYVLLQEAFHELTNGPPGGTEITAGGSDGTLPHLEGGWGMTPEGGYGRADDVLRWLRGWQNEMLSDLGGMIAGVQTATGADDVEIAPGVRMRIKPEALSRLLQMPDTPNAWT